jgi:S1-C subfamily serine protease
MGDIMLKMGSADVDSIEDLLNEIHKRKVGEKVRITVFRRGFEHFLEVALSKMP